MSFLCIFRSWKKRVKETKIIELLVQRLSTEPKPTTVKYSREGPKDFVLFEYEEVTIDNIKNTCQKYFKEHRNGDVLALWPFNKALHAPG